MTESKPAGCWPSELGNLAAIVDRLADGVALLAIGDSDRVVAWNQCLNQSVGELQTQVGQDFANRLLSASATSKTPTTITYGDDRTWRVSLVDLPPGQNDHCWQIAVVHPIEHSSDPPTTRDPLTGVADRRTLDRWIERNWSSRDQGAQPLAAVFIDFDGFKQINDIHGHLAGDQALVTLAGRLQAIIRADDLLVRFGGDEFVVVATGVDSSKDLQQLVRRLSSVVEEPVVVDGTATRLGVSIGAANSDEGFASFADMLAAADQRMYEQKRSMSN